MAQANISAVLDESKKAWVHKELEPRPHEDFARKTWMHTYKSSTAWIWACPKEHNMLNERYFPVVAHTFF